MSCIPIQDFSLISLCDATKAGKLYSIVPDTGVGDFDVTRASTATYLGSDGLLKTAANNEPRIEFNPDGSYKGLLVEPAATNLLLRSEEFDNAYWNLVGDTTITANDAVAPDGTMTADRIDIGTSGSTAFMGLQRTGSDTYANGVTYTASIFVKSLDTVNRANLRIRAILTGGDTLANGVFDLSGNGSVISGDSPKIEKIGDYFRISITFVGDGNNYRFIFTPDISPFRPNIGQSALIWGAQLETSSVATSYIPTVASTVTRAADVITRTGASALIGQTEGTVYMEVDVRNYFTNQLRTLLSVTGNSNIQLEVSTNGNFAFRIGSLVNVNVGNVSNLNGILKIAVVYNTSTGGTLYINGSIIYNLTGATGITDLDNIGVGIRPINNDRHLGDHIRAVALLPTAISEQAAINLTT